MGGACPALQVGVACYSRAYKYSLQPFLSIRDLDVLRQRSQWFESLIALRSHRCSVGFDKLAQPFLITFPAPKHSQRPKDEGPGAVQMNVLKNA